ncbi:DNA-binding protein YbiB [Comamonas sp.]|uniref:DNA-binding protein YbiB n=1 Tax=Comamonas sp. TaxID=34028 RepID=UPI0028A0E4D0|nr:DNA-binding protein YbiB [Comamonas sp.]
MHIQQYLKEIGRGKDGARALTRAQAFELLGWILDGHAQPLQVGAFCLAMRIKGETAQEMAGFMDAVHARLPRTAHAASPVIVLPSYNGARRLPVLTPLLALLLVRQGLPVLLHGSTTESTRITAAQVLEQLGHPAAQALQTPQAGELLHLSARTLLPGLADLLDARAAIGLRNPAHSLVKHLNPLAASGTHSLVVGCYTHPEYSISMEHTHAEAGSHALLLRGMEGEPVADPRRQPALRGIIQGCKVLELHAETGALPVTPELPHGLDMAATIAWTREVLQDQRPVPAPIATQVQVICDLHRQLAALPATQGAQA